MVVDDIDNDGDAAAMGGIDETPESVDPAIGVLNGEGKDAVITPVALARTLSKWHQLDRVDAEFEKVIQTRDNAVEILSGRKGSGVQFVNDGVAERYSLPAVVGPLKLPPVDHRRQGMHAVGLTKGSGVGEGFASIDRKPIPVSGTNGQGYLPVAVFFFLQGVPAIGFDKLRAFGQRRPNAEFSELPFIPRAYV